MSRLVDKKYLTKVGPGLYLYPGKSRFGNVLPKEAELVKLFLKSSDFLVFSTNLYNQLGLGITQLKNETFVYNNKRHGEFELSGNKFSFKRPNNGFPRKLTKEFLFVDLMNNLKVYIISDDIPSNHPEFKNWIWLDPELLPEKAISFKKNVYRKINEIFIPMINNFNASNYN